MNVLNMYRCDDIIKGVMWNGYYFNVPIWVGYLAMDKNGNLYAYQENAEPEVRGSYWYETKSFDKDSILLAKIEYDGDWKDSLVKV